MYSSNGFSTYLREYGAVQEDPQHPFHIIADWIDSHPEHMQKFDPDPIIIPFDNYHEAVTERRSKDEWNEENDEWFEKKQEAFDRALGSLVSLVLKHETDKTLKERLESSAQEIYERF